MLCVFFFPLLILCFVPEPPLFFFLVVYAIHLYFTYKIKQLTLLLFLFFFCFVLFPSLSCFRSCILRHGSSSTCLWKGKRKKRKRKIAAGPDERCFFSLLSPFSSNFIFLFCFWSHFFITILLFFPSN